MNKLTKKPNFRIPKEYKQTVHTNQWTIHYNSTDTKSILKLKEWFGI